ncbi:TIGR03943 family protein [Mycobacterium sp. CBMA293]|uniref:TIGR03943 family putative permease subunit n=1 Tax=unclassified Mycolicibacterium TaxID=2636767 RepID=UPI0013218EC8|nr:MULTISPECIES: TIGR03943 family protein [unclassified Mycolicibacterium]MUL46275.1 TIGR03943 family protein [Mycolicibacterium sp. CBMA 360]MUL97281.1 TIGR03943 family protein [Mycolicibacterium sp. CBMA 230]MUM33137.1 TIGR03943 family protein [Mycolicibacterium sp. CBMA 361]MUL58671.1 TIGR03943 family protein [Mycolicibacterium sp. CBMA 335]MUL69065.1 TIGR03943 family protein [Mycolicibacterium sp. CBMA 311]
MSRETQNLLVLLIGLSMGLIAVKGTYLNFVKPALFPFLIVAAVLLVALALVCLARDLRNGPPRGHHHHRGLLAWLLLVPVALTAFVSVPPMSAVGAETVTAAVAPPKRAFPRLPADGVVSLPEVVMRAAADSTKSLDGRTITVTGFTMGTDLARVVIVCCAADAQLARVHLTGTIGPHPNDTWLKVQGKVVPGTSNPSTNFVPTMEVTRVDPIPKPRNTYAY